MSETGFFAQKRNSPTSLGLVILLHAAQIAAVVLIKSPAFIHLVDPPLVVTLDPNDPVPPPDQPPPPRLEPQHPTETFQHLPPLVPTQPQGPAVETHEGPIELAGTTVGSGKIDIPALPPEPVHVPVRQAAQIDSSSRLQPPYPPSEIRAERDGRVQVRITIGPDGRVIDVTRISATSDAFWLVTREQALRYWRFRPATVDGRPVQESRTMSLVFRIQDQG